MLCFVVNTACCAPLPPPQTLLHPPPWLPFAGLHFEPSFSLTVSGLAAAHFYTTRQHLQPGQLPWSIQDEWVQHVYPCSAQHCGSNPPAAAYNMAVVQISHDDGSQSHATGDDTPHQQHEPTQRPLHPLQLKRGGDSGALVLALPVTVADFGRPLEWLQRTATAMRTRQRQMQSEAVVGQFCILPRPPSKCALRTVLHPATLLVAS